MNTSHSSSACCNRRKPVRRWLIRRRLRKLKLDHNQLEKVDDLIARAGSEGQHRSCFNRALQQHIRDVLTDDGFDRDRAFELIRSAAAQQIERQTELVAAYGEFYQGLDPQQQRQLKAMWKQHRRCRSRCCH